MDLCIEAKRAKDIPLEKIDTHPQERLTQSLIEIAVESWRFAKLFTRLISRLDAGESSRFVNQSRYYVKRLEESLEAAAMRLVNVEGQPYEPGMAAAALNLGDFGPDDRLLVDQMVVPIIMGPEGLLRAGTIMLRKAEL
jgi:hypothetical protein